MTGAGRQRVSFLPLSDGFALARFQWEKGAMRMLIVTLSAALMLLSIAPQADAGKSHLKCGGDNLQCGSLAKVCNLKNGKCCCMNVSQ